MLFVGVQSRDVNLVKYLIHTIKIDVNFAIERYGGVTALYFCNYNYDVALELFNAGAVIPPADRVYCSFTPLNRWILDEKERKYYKIWKSKQQHPKSMLEFTKLMVERGNIDVRNRLDQVYETALFSMAVCPDEEQDVVTLLRYLVFEQGVDPHRQNQFGESFLHRALIDGLQDIKVVKFAVEELGVDATLEDRISTNCLFGALRNSNKRSNILEVVRYLIEKGGCDPYHYTKYGRTVLRFSISGLPGELDTIKYLVEEMGVDPLQVEKGSKETILFNLGGYNNSKHLSKTKFGECEPELRNKNRKAIVSYLTKQCGVDINATNATSETIERCVFSANEGGEYLLDWIQFLDQQGLKWTTKALLEAVKTDNVDVVKFILSRPGVNPKSLAESKLVMLDAAVNPSKAVEIMKTLVEAVPELKSMPCFSGSLLKDVIARGAHFDTVKYVVEELGADVNKPDRRGRTPIFAIPCSSTSSSQLELLIYLLNKGGADPTIKDSKGETVLFQMCRHNYRKNLSMIMYLVNRYPSLCIRDKNYKNKTVVYKAVHGGASLELIKHLIKIEGLDPHIVSRNKNTNLMFHAMRSSSPELILYLLNDVAVNPTLINSQDRSDCSQHICRRQFSEDTKLKILKQLHSKGVKFY